MIKEVANFGSKAILDAFNDLSFRLRNKKHLLMPSEKILENNILSKEKPVEEKNQT